MPEFHNLLVWAWEFGFWDYLLQDRWESTYYSDRCWQMKLETIWNTEHWVGHIHIHIYIYVHIHI